MRIASKLTLVLLLVVSAVLAVYIGTRVGREKTMFVSDMQRDHHVMARGLGAGIAEVWKSDGEDRALRLVEQANARESDLTIRWIWLDAPAGDAHAPSPPHDVAVDVAKGVEVTWLGPEDTLVTLAPLDVPTDRPGALEISEPMSEEDAFIRLTRLRLATFTVAILLSSGFVVTTLGALLVGRPARRLVEQARRIGGGDFSTRLEPGSTDELGELAAEMNAMCDQLAEARDRVAAESRARLDMADQLRHADRLRTIGQLASGIAHELGTPLNVVDGHARMIATGEVTGPEIADSARVISEQAERMTRIIRQLLDFARGRRPQKGTEDLGPLVTRTFGLLGPLAKKRRATLELDCPEPVRAQVDGGQIEQVLTNLVVNGLQAMAEGGRLRVRVDRDDGLARIVVQDDGPGIPADAIGHVFDPFFTTKGVGEGTGLGLAVSWGIVAEHGGRIDVESPPGGGARFSVWLPLEAT